MIVYLLLFRMRLDNTSCVILLLEFVVYAALGVCLAIVVNAACKLHLCVVTQKTCALLQT